MAIDAGVTLLRIPDACLVSLHSVEKDEQFGKSLFAIVGSLSTYLLVYFYSIWIWIWIWIWISITEEKDKAIIISWWSGCSAGILFLAHLPQLRQKQSISFYNPYLDTLPSFLHGASDKNNNDESNVDNKKEGRRRIFISISAATKTMVTRNS